MKKIILQTLAVLAVIIAVSSCQYKFIVEPTIPPVDPGDTTNPISFSAEIEPIFTNTNCTDCHGTGGTKPDLTTGNAYNSINTMGLADTADPESSIIYVKPNPNGNHYKKYSSSDAALILGWISQGAKNN